MTLDTPAPAAVPGPARPSDDALLVARARVGLWTVVAALALFTLADFRLAGDALHATLLVRLVQFAVTGAAAVGLRVEVARRLRIALVAAFIGAIYATSAVAGALRGQLVTQPITDLVIAFATATTLPWGPWPQLATVAVAIGALVGAALALPGGLGAVSPHLVAGIGAGFVASVYVAYQVERHRRERDAAEAALRRSEEHFRALIEHGSDVITVIDHEGMIRYESPSIERLLGWRPEERVGQRASAGVHPDDLPVLRDAIVRALGDGASPVECRARRRDGSWCDVEAVATNLLAHPSIAGIVVNWRDIGERKRAEAERGRYVRELAEARDAALASTEAKSRFLANMSHEIRTPMNVIIGLTDMLLDSSLAPDQRGHLGRLRTASMGLLAILNDVLDASKIEAGKMRIEVVDVDLRRLVAEVVELLQPAATAKGLVLACRLPADVPSPVKGDPVRLRQALVNLVSNAVKFTEAGGVTVELAVLQRVRSQVGVRISVADTGVGIPPERQAAIFECFEQGDDSTTRVYGGTGLGLAIARQLVALMGGRLGLDSAPGRGSTFWIELTLECAVAAA